MHRENNKKFSVYYAVLTINFGDGSNNPTVRACDVRMEMAAMVKAERRTQLWVEAWLPLLALLSLMIVGQVGAIFVL